MEIQELQQRIHEMKEEQFLRYLCEQAHGNPQATLNVGDAAEVMGLPYGEAIRIADELREEGYLRRVGRLNAPHGPGVRLTPEGVRAAAA